MSQQLNRNSWNLSHQKRKSLRFDTADRKAENRTKIQLGGLILKAGLASHLEIEPGDDLQLDPVAREKATTLLGVLLQSRNSFRMIMRVLSSKSVLIVA